MTRFETFSSSVQITLGELLIPFTAGNSAFVSFVSNDCFVVTQDSIAARRSTFKSSLVHIAQKNDRLENFGREEYLIPDGSIFKLE